MALDYSQLYWFHENHWPFAGGMRASPEKDVISDDWPLLRGDVRPRKAIRFDRHTGKRVCDVIWTTWPAVVLVSKAFRDVLTREGFTGWSTYPVVVHDACGKILRGYAGLAVTGRSGPHDKSRSKKVWRGPYVEGGPKVRNIVGVFFQDNRWDGSDIFLLEGSARMVVTSRVKEALQELLIPNVAFEALDVHEMDDFPDR